uniref:Uncharacterized protein n=1 Tax=Hubei reo-like virus 5 TaxID=1923180 RepID=A0A1L3KP90_9VIRU|nr:hypothetical protein [Hubei reo-like virus 5]
MATKQTSKTLKNRSAKNEPSPAIRKSQSNPPVLLNVTQTLSQDSSSRERQNVNLGKEHNKLSIHPSAPTIRDIDSDHHDDDGDSDTSGSISELQSLLGIGRKSVPGLETENSKTLDLMVKGNWGKIAYNASTGMECEWISGTNEMARDNRAHISEGRNKNKEGEEGEGYSRVHALLSEMQRESNESERRLLHENLRGNESNVQRRNLFQLTPFSYNGTNVSPSSQGTLSPGSTTHIYPQGIDLTFISAKTFNSRSYEQVCRIISGGNRRPFEGEMHGGTVYKISDYIIVRKGVLRNGDWPFFEICSEEIVNTRDSSCCTIA